MTRQPPARTEHWQSRLEALIAKHGVPGATLAVLDGSEMFEAAAGVTSLRTRQPVTSDTLFLLGSITKVYTATLVMRLVEAGRLSLDDPIQRHLPELDLGDSDVSEQITIARLLDHSSGIPGELFIDTGRGDDCLERYVAQVAGTRFLHRPGAMWSYCNSGYMILGRLLERVHGKVFDTILRDELFAPLSSATATTFAEEAILQSVAVGHLPGPDGLMVTPQWALMRSAGPAGGICGTVRDLLTFGRMHLNGGSTEADSRILDAATAAAMRVRRQVCPDPYNLAAGWGLGVALYDWGGVNVFGHDGNNIGQLAYLRCVPDRGAIALCTNVTIAGPLFDDLVGELARDLFGLHIPKPPTTNDAVGSGLERLAGTYGEGPVAMTFSVADGALTLGPTQYTGTQVSVLKPLDDSRFLVNFPIFAADFIAAFLEPDSDGRPAYVHLAGRAWPRMSS